MHICPRCCITLQDGETCHCGEERRKCPYCAMEVPAAAAVCAHCRKNISVAGMMGDGFKALGTICFLLFTVPAVIALFLMFR